MIRTWLPAAAGDRRRLDRLLISGLNALRGKDIVSRLWDKEDVWTRDRGSGPGTADVRRVLGWLDSPAPAAADSLAAAAAAFAGEARRDGLTDAIVIGMGGSSLAPDLFSRAFASPADPPALRLRVLDSTAPDAVRRALDLPPARTLHVVSSKSGTTTETLSLFNAFFDRARSALGGIAAAGTRFVAVTDPGTPLEALGRTLGFRRIFAGPPDVGGRFSALTAFGLVPAALGGVDLVRLLDGARAMAGLCRLDLPDPGGRPAAFEDGGNPGAALGVILGTLAAAGRDKLMLRMPPSMPGFYEWTEQLIAESTGKDGCGLLPVPLDLAEISGQAAPDRLIVILHAEGEALPEADIGRLNAQGVPVFGLALAEARDRVAAETLGGQIFLWEFATAVAGVVLRLNPFDQPDVELTKSMTRKILAGGGSAGPAGAPAEDGGILVHGGRGAGTVAEILRLFLDEGRTGDYIALQAFLDPSDENGALVEKVRQALGRRRGLPATSGFGPRYLHSTGQLHKGDAGRGLFVQLTGRPHLDLPIPGVPGSPAPASTFGALLSAQSWADWLALRERGRRVLRLEFTGPAREGLELVLAALGTGPRAPGM